MFEDYQICPYTGLRSFSEEESLYFKGREENIDQATAQLQRNKFLMLTGASGDGKSSLVYAGIIPNARAGFLKSHYTQWSVADFRPERSPFKNLCKAVATQLEIEMSTAESELSHGFSALVDLYKNSKRFIDTDAVGWQQADEKERNALRRSASNLIIIVDQFEEFFTNPENYSSGAPSTSSNLVLNVLLETSRIALEENLPVYIIFTMRSDYIGQCAAFRSLPEYIGFSQFFVPRLNRSQLQQVIEEPATLSGNRISRRLTERLIHDVAEGVDQLPILQHALNQIWHAADQGKAEMDLLHYAMVGGMNVAELPEEQVGSFNKWFLSLPDTIKSFYHEPNLQNVLDTHANKLYEGAGEHYRKFSGKPISDEQARAIVKTAFVCLTKIDQGRAVRNRMTLKEITDIYGQPGTEESIVAGVLHIFRESGNTFIRPFITGDTGTIPLQENQVMDITHESLIRNWELLGQWAKEEFDNYTVFLDFEQQLNRWMESGKSRNFLLPIGPLTYFEGWYHKVKPNSHWIARYVEEDTNPNGKLEKGVAVLRNTRDFLKQSAARHIVTRAVMRYGGGKIAAAAGIVVLLIGGAYMINYYFSKQNAHVLKVIRKDVLQLMNSPKVAITNTGVLLTEALQDDVISVRDITSHASDFLSAIRTNFAVAELIIAQGRCEPNDKLNQALAKVDSLFGSYVPARNSADQSQEVLKELVFHQHSLELAMLYKPTAGIMKYHTKTARYCADFVLYILTKQPEKFTDINTLHRALEHAINANAFTKEELDKLVGILSPFENKKRTDWLQKRYQRDNLMKRGIFDYSFAFNGIFQELAYLYAALGEAPKALRAVDSLLVYNQTYYQNSYAQQIDNASNIAGVFYSSGHSDQVDAFAGGYCSRSKVALTEFYERLLGRTSPGLNVSLNGDPTAAHYSDGNLQYGTLALTGFFSDKLRQAIASEKNTDAGNFKLALAYKNEGILKAQKLDLRNADSPEIFRLYDTAIYYYRKVSTPFLNQLTNIVGQGAADHVTVPTSYLFVSPDFRTSFHPLEERNANTVYTSFSFANFLTSRKLLDEFYKSDADVAAFQEWLVSFYAIMSDNPPYLIKKDVKYEDAMLLQSTISTSSALKKADLNYLYFYTSEKAFARNNKPDFLSSVAKVRQDLLSNTLAVTGVFSFRAAANIVAALIHFDLPDSAHRLVHRFKDPVNRSTLFAYAACTFLLHDIDQNKVGILMDSARAEMQRPSTIPSGSPPNRIMIAYALALQNSDAKLDEAYKIIKNIEDKTYAMWFITRGLAFEGQLDKAIRNIPADASDDDHTNYLWFVLDGYGHRETKPEWKEYSEHYPWNLQTPIRYLDESH